MLSQEAHEKVNQVIIAISDGILKQIEQNQSVNLEVLESLSELIDAVKDAVVV